MVRTGALGDTILLIPTVRLLHQHLPSADLTLLGSRVARDLLELSSTDCRYFPYDSPTIGSLFTSGPFDLPEILRRVDAAVLYTSDPDGPLKENLQRSTSGPLICWPVEPTRGQHAAAHFARAVTRHPLTDDELPPPAFRAKESARGAARQWLFDHGSGSQRPLAAIHPGSGSRQKCWPPERFASLARTFHQDGWGIIVVEGPADQRQREEMLTRLPGLAVFRRKGLEELAGLLSLADVCISNDSGVGHLAAALGTPTVSIFGPTDPAVWRPLGPRTLAVRGMKGKRPQWPSVQRVRDAVCRLVTR
mgnify:CR=1 FL=1